MAVILFVLNRTCAMVNLPLQDYINLNYHKHTKASTTNRTDVRSVVSLIFLFIHSVESSITVRQVLV